MTDTPVNTWELAQNIPEDMSNYHTGKGWKIRHH